MTGHDPSTSLSRAGRRARSLLGAALLLLVAGPAGAAPGDVYQRHCAVCHGVEGRGDGPAAGLLDPRPVDFTAGRSELPVDARGNATHGRGRGPDHRGGAARDVDAGLRGSSVFPRRSTRSFGTSSRWPRHRPIRGSPSTWDRRPRRRRVRWLGAGHSMWPRVAGTATGLTDAPRPGAPSARAPVVSRARPTSRSPGRSAVVPPSRPSRVASSRGWTARRCRHTRTSCPRARPATWPARGEPRPRRPGRRASLGSLARAPA